MENLLQPSHGIVVQDVDVLQPEPIRQGGLVRKDVVRPVPINTRYLHADALEATQVQTTRKTSGTTNATHIRSWVGPPSERKEGSINIRRW